MKAARLTACLLLIALLLSSCGIIILNGGDDSRPVTESETLFPPLDDDYETSRYPEATETDGEAVSKDRLAALPDRDFDGLTVFFTVAEEAGPVFDEENDLYRSVVLKRNEMVNKKYNAKIIVDRKPADLLLTEVANAEKAGSFYSDFAVIRNADFGEYLVGNYLLNLKSLPFTDYDAPYFRQSAMAQLTVKNAVYGAVGDAVDQIETYAALYLNRDYAKSLSLSLDYGAVYDGRFTWETLLTMLAAVPEEGVGFVSDNDRMTTASLAFLGTGGSFLARNDKGQLRLACETDAADALVDCLKRLLPSVKTTLTVPADVLPEMGEESEILSAERVLSGFEIFAEGKALCALGSVGQMPLLENAGFSWEILPLPKLMEELPYCTPVTADAPIIVALASSHNADTMGYILQAVNAASCGYITGEFYDDAMLRLTTGVHTPDMLDLIRANPVYDLAAMLSEDAKAVREGTYVALDDALDGKRAFAYYLGKREKALNRFLDDLR